MYEVDGVYDVQKIETSLRGEPQLSVRGQDSSRTKVPARVREIITRNLATDDLDPAMATKMNGRESSQTIDLLREENQVLWLWLVTWLICLI